MLLGLQLFFFVNQTTADLQSSGTADTFPGMDGSRLTLVSVKGSSAIVRNDGTSPVTELIMFVNGEMLNYDITDNPILPGQIREINYNSRLENEPLEIKVLYNRGKQIVQTSPASSNTAAAGFTDEVLPLNEGEVEEEDEIFFLDGATIKCPNAQVGQTFEHEGNTYYVVNDDSIAGNLSAGNRVCTTHVTGMSAGTSAFVPAAYYTTQGINISDWDISNVTNMYRMFYNAIDFNQFIGDWNTSKVTTMQDMFNGARVFNQFIGDWDTFSVTNMQYMFRNARGFNQPIGSWNISKVTTMYGMFSYANVFNQPIGDWDTSSVTTMYTMFNNALSFNQTIGSWNTSKVNNMYGMFQSASAFNQDLKCWDVHLISSKPGEFDTSSALSSENLPVWGTSGSHCVINGILKCHNLDVGASFESGSQTYQVVDDASIAGNMTAGNRVCTTHVNNMNGTSSLAFVPEAYYAIEGISISDWDTSNVINMAYMFRSASSFNQPIAYWNVSNVINMEGMFRGASFFNQNISSWDVSKVTNMNRMFSGASSFNQPIGSWDVSNVANMQSMYYQAFAFNQNINMWNVSKVTNMDGLFWDAQAFNQNISSWDVSKVTNMDRMFWYASSFNQDIGSWDVSNVANMDSMFYVASAFNQDLKCWNVTLIGPPMPSNFDTSSGFAGQTEKHPQWGTDGSSC